MIDWLAEPLGRAHLLRPVIDPLTLRRSGEVVVHSFASFLQEMVVTSLVGVAGTRDVVHFAAQSQARPCSGHY